MARSFVLLTQSSWVNLCYENRTIIVTKLELYMKNSIVAFTLLSVFACGKAKKETDLSKGMSVGDSMNLSDNNGDGDLEHKDDGNESSSDRSPTPEEPEGYDYTAKLIPAGTFTMGCTSEQDSDCYDSEKPSHEVTIDHDFYMMESEVTQTVYQRVMRNNPSSFQGLNRPVENVSWFDAVKFANTLSSIEGLEKCYSVDGNTVSWLNLSCTGWRLPTEAEWEYAARGGESHEYAGSDIADEIAWYRENSNTQTHDVCGKQVNGYGLCDMSGNVSEWVWDFYGEYPREPVTNPRGVSSASRRVFRGGDWINSLSSLRSSGRSNYTPSGRNGIGFRLARSVQ